jgi:hypothetical protein
MTEEMMTVDQSGRYEIGDAALPPDVRNGFAFPAHAVFG